MTSQGNKQKFECRSAAISSYLDGEMPPDEELEFELHLAECSGCLTELNEQKSFLQTLSMSMSMDREPDIELPQNFAKRIVATAESSVEGLRARKERSTAIVIVATLVVLLVAILGSETLRAFTPVAAFIEQAGSVVGVIGNFAFNLFVGASVLVRSVTGQFASGAVVVFGLVVFAVFALLVSRRVLRGRRA